MSSYNRGDYGSGRGGRGGYQSGNSFGSQGGYGGGRGGFQSGNSFGSQSGYGGQQNGGAGQKGYHPNQDLGKYLKDVDWSREKLTPFTKVFYREGQSKRSDEEIRQYRKQNEIQIIDTQGHPMPNPFITWDETFFPGYIMQEVKQAGFGNPTPIQSQSFPIILSGHDLIGIAKTGSGKTLSFLLPSVVHINAQSTVKPGDGPIILVIAPTRELAVQIQEQCHKFGSSSKITSTCVYGGADKEKQKQDLKRGVDICIATPGRLIDFLDKGVTNLRRVTYLVLDEADRMLDMGFEPQIRKLLGQIRPDRQTLMFSATWPKEVQKLAQDICQNNPLHIQIGDFGMTVNKNIRQIIEVIGQTQKLQRLIKYLESMSSQDKVLVFTQTKKNCDILTQSMRKERFPALPIHGDKSQGERDDAILAFKKGDCRILIATDVAQRGLDIKDVTFVINYDFPKHLEDYIHRIGRTGRAGAVGTSISFMTFEDDKSIAKEALKLLEDSQQEVPEELRKLAQAGIAQKQQKNASKYSSRRRSRSPENRASFGGSSFAELKRQQQGGQYGATQQQPSSTGFSGAPGLSGISGGFPPAQTAYQPPVIPQVGAYVPNTSYSSQPPQPSYPYQGPPNY